MGRPYHGRRRRRPRTRRRYRGGGLPRGSDSFQAFGLKCFYDLLMPDVRGRARRKFFNQLCTPVALACGLVAAMVGGELAGPLGAIIGLGAGFVVASEYLVQGRLYRP